MNSDFVAQLRKVIRKAVKVGSDAATREASISLAKAMVKSSPEHGPEIAYTAILHHLRAPHSPEREAAMQAFRAKFVASMDAVLCATTGYRADKPLPPPASAANQLRNTALSLLDGWNKDFGSSYKPLALAISFAKVRLGVRQERQDLPLAQSAPENGRSGNESRNFVDEDTAERSAREWQVHSILQDAPTLLQGAGRKIGELDAKLKKEMEKHGHSIFDAILQQPASRQETQEPQQRVDLASLGVFGTQYEVEVASTAAPLLRGDQSAREELHVLALGVKNRVLPQMERWQTALSGIGQLRALTQAERQLLERIERQISSAQDVIRRSTDAGAMVKVKRAVGNATAAGGMPGEDEDDDEMEDVALPSMEERATRRGWDEDFQSASLSPQDEYDDKSRNMKRMLEEGEADDRGEWGGGGEGGAGRGDGKRARMLP